MTDKNTELKMVLCVRTDLKMKKGKIAAQCCHAAVGAYKRSMKYRPKYIEQFDKSGSAKVALKVEKNATMPFYVNM